MPDNRKELGLIGKTLSHSFSKAYFEQKFSALDIRDYSYELFELDRIEELLPLIETHPQLVGLNVTIPYKQEVIPFLQEISPEAETIGAVNVIKIQEGKLAGFNSDYFGFKTSLLNWLPNGWLGESLILGTGGASLAVMAVLDDCSIPFQRVSRSRGPELVTYEDVSSLDLLSTHKLIINTTPLGMQPNVESAPDLTYNKLSKDHFLYDLVYNPESTRFMQLGESQGASVKNGLEMLELQAEKSWEIWTGQVENDKSQNPNSK